MAGNITDLIYKELSYDICGLLYKVHNELGRYSNEKQYGDKFEDLLVENKFKYEREKVLEPSFKGEKKGRNRLDFLIEGKIIIEFKVTRILTREDYYQVRRYLDATSLKLGLLVNFRAKHLCPKRILNSKAKV